MHVKPQAVAFHGAFSEPKHVPRDLRPARAPNDRLAVALLYTPLIGVTLISKFAVTLGGTEILIGIPLMLAATGFGVITGRLKLAPSRVHLYLGMIAVLTAEQVLAVNTFSISSFMLMLALHIPYAFQIEGSGDSALHHDRFLNLALFICIAGIVQYAGQFVIGVKYAYPIEHFTPDQFITHNYNYLNPLHYGSPIMKANGVFLLEPSYFSQLLATGFAIEAVGPQRLWRLALFLVGFGVSYSGTGLIMMAVTIPALILVSRRYSLLVVIGLVAVIAIGGSEVLGLDVYTKRLEEFNSTNTSAYQRYVGPALVLQQYLLPSMQRFLFGIGSGMMMRMTPAPIFNVTETGWAKVILEYGFVGAIAYFGFLYGSIFGSKQSIVLRVNLAMMTLVSGIFDGPPHGMILTLLLWLSAPSESAPTLGPQVNVQRIPNAVIASRRPALPTGESR